MNALQYPLIIAELSMIGYDGTLEERSKAIAAVLNEESEFSDQPIIECIEE